MPPLSFSGYRFPRDIIQRAVWMYLRFTLSFRDVEELPAERGIAVTHASIRRWVLTFGPAIARRLRAGRLKPHSRWHLDEMFVRVGGNRCTCGGLSMRKARSWTCSSRLSATRRLLAG
jgi:transposase-like protein